MSREDLGILFPENFVLGMRLYKIIQKCRGSQSSSLTEPDVESVASIFSTPSSSRVQRSNRSIDSDKDSQVSDPSSSRLIKKKHPSPQLPFTDPDAPSKRPKHEQSISFSLPMFSEDIEHSIDQDSVFTTQQRNKIIRECCRALQGHCKKNVIPVTSAEKRYAAQLLHKNVQTALEVR